MRKVDPIGLAKAILWEEAKGKLRAMIAADGAEMGEERDEQGYFHYMKLKRAVNKFIKSFEEDGLHE